MESPSESRSDHKFWLLVAVVAIGVAAIPLVIGWRLTPAEYQFYPNSALNPWDQSVYLSYIEQGRGGSVFMEDLMTGEEQTATLFQPFWWLLGRLAELFQLSNSTVYVLARFTLIPVLVLSIWWAAKWFFADQLSRRVATVTSLFAGGLGGWLILLSGNFSILNSPDLWVSEAVPALSLLTAPHFLLVTSGILITLVAVERAWREKDNRLIVLGGISAAVVWSIHPFHVLTWIILWLILSLIYGIRQKELPWRYVKTWVLVGLIGSPPLMLFGLQFFFDPLVAERSQQNVNLTWSFGRTILLLGALLPAVITSLIRLPKHERFAWALGLTAAYLIAIYLPLHFQRRLSHGILIPFAFLATPALVFLWHNIREKHLILRGTVVTLVGLWLTFSWMLVQGIIVNAYQYELEVDPIRRSYHSPEYQAMIQAVRDNRTTPGSLLADEVDSKMIVGLTGQRVFLASSIETLNYKTKRRQVNFFFATDSRAWQQRFLEQHQICLIQYGQDEAALGRGFLPGVWNDLTLLWSGQERALYRTSFCE